MIQAEFLFRLLTPLFAEPVRVGGELVGGVSGSREEDDIACTRYALKTLGSE